MQLVLVPGFDKLQHEHQLQHAVSFITNSKFVTKVVDVDEIFLTPLLEKKE